jgi:2-dehydro-3-deoxygalactonokinase
VILALDSGTTTTRVWVLADGAVAGHASAHAGARDVARSGDREWLLRRLRQVADEALAQGAADWASIEAVVAFGMITSELGIEELPHLVAPIGLGELAAGMRVRDWLPAPVFLVPGVRTGNGHGRGVDVMRGEETEAVGLLSIGLVQPPFLYVSTGSHTKFVEVDSDGRIVASVTTLSGELLWALRRETILADLVDLTSGLHDAAHVEDGAASTLRDGLSRALFAARLLNRVGRAPPSACSDFVHGAVAMSDLLALDGVLTERPGPRRVALSGSSPLAQAHRMLIGRQSWVEELQVVERPLGAVGAELLYRIRTGQDADPAERSIRA